MILSTVNTFNSIGKKTQFLARLDGGGERPHEAVASLSGGWPAVQL
jgi:hypothetical protein